MDFTFNATAGASQSTAKPRLAGNNIYNVKFVGCELKDVKGVKDPDALYQQLILKFENEDGSFEHTVWEPRPDDFKRTENTFENKKTGKEEKIPQASNVETMMLLFKHAIDAIVPAIGKKIDDKEVNLTAANWVDLRQLVANILDKGKGVETRIKLMKHGKTGEAVFPGYFTGLTKEGKAYIRNNFIGAKVAYSVYELQRINNEATAKPSNPETYSDFVPETMVKDTAGLNMDFDL